MEIVVQKFGGTSVGSSKAIQNLYNRVIECNSDVKIVVSSAMSGVTDLLIKAAKLSVYQLDQSYVVLEEIKRLHINTISSLEIHSNDFFKLFNEKIEELKNILTGVNYISELTNKILDKIQSFGEQFSTFILYNYFLINSIKCELLDSRDFINTDSSFGEARVDWDLTKSNFSNFEIQQGTIFIFQGFIGSDIHGNTTTLGRGGSDYSASIIGFALKQNGYNVKQIEIWTDVDGIMTADPRIEKSVETVKEISYDHVLKLSYFGAKVIHPDTVKPAVELNIPVVVRNTFNPINSGTIILKNSVNNQNVKVDLKNTYLILIKDFDQSKIIEITNKLLNLLIASGSIIYHQYTTVYQSEIIYRETFINLEDYLSDIQFEIKPITINAFIGNIKEIEMKNKNYIKGINDDIILVID